jgi:hypothetical protein
LEGVAEAAAPHRRRLARRAGAKGEDAMRKTIIVALTIAALAATASAQLCKFSVVIPAGASKSAVFLPSSVSLANCDGAPLHGGTLAPIAIIPPAAVDATTDAILVELCTSTAGSSCTQVGIGDGTLDRLKIVQSPAGTPTQSIRIDPQIGATWYAWKLALVTSLNAADIQDAARTFTLFVRPL